MPRLPKFHHCRSFLIGFTLAALLFSLTLQAGLDSVWKEITYGVSLIFQGEEVTFSEDMLPFTMDGRVFLSVRGMADLLDLPLEYDPATNTVTIGEQAGNTDPDSEDGQLSSNEYYAYLKENYPRFSIDGGTTLVPLHQALEDLFASGETISHSKTVAAFEAFVRGETDVLISSGFNDELEQMAADQGIDLANQEFAREAFVFLINASNPVQNLGLDQIKDIFSGKITNWAEVGGDDAPIRAFQRNSDSGSQMRMEKVMGDTPLMSDNVTYIVGMGDVIEAIENYDEGKYSIAYNMFTFTEKQYPSDEVVLLSIDGIAPSDASIYDGSYPISFSFSLYYDAHNSAVAEFVSNLRGFLVSESGQALLSDAGYIALNPEAVRNTEVAAPPSEDYYNRLDFYDAEKGVFNYVDNEGHLLVFASYADYVLRDSAYAASPSAREALEVIAASKIPLWMRTVFCDEEEGSINVIPWRSVALDEMSLFNFEYQDAYYNSLVYLIDEGEYWLRAVSQESFAIYQEYGQFETYSAYLPKTAPGTSVQLTESDLTQVKMRSEEIYALVDGVRVDEFRYDDPGLQFEIVYFSPFE